MTRHTISVLVENKFGVLARIAGLFSGRGYNIHSLNVAPSQDPRFSRMTIVVREKEDVLDQIIKHLEKLVNTVEVVDFRNTDNVYRETVSNAGPSLRALTKASLVLTLWWFTANTMSPACNICPTDFFGFT